MRAARLEDLLAVRGLSEIKARHILDYLAQHPETAEVKHEKRKLPLQAKNGIEGATFPARLSDAIPYTLGRVVEALLSAPPEGFRPRLVRELGQFARGVEDLNHTKGTLKEREWRPMLRRLSDACDLLRTLSAQKEIRRKEQAEIADFLYGINETLQPLRNESAPAETEEAHV